MARLYVWLVDAGFSAEYLDRCTLLDLDLLAAQVNELRKSDRGRPRL
ncbi:hypothetical protein H5P28_00335 [Ruficoccus amylovorans]|uniref:Uncharacterized protein n=1 Tax=Ruficoccus amylovorans TaxID=1804625 RepID=A0A842H9B2_9BACT|nr:hypothetical protein [Ruficoccus amylovorans]MBC2592699.1 hypothetical protein [Ruficoccus amylovorans]